MTAMILSPAVSPGSLRVSRCQGNRTLFTGGTFPRGDHERGGSAPVTAATLVR